MQVCSPEEEDLQCIHFNTIVLLLSDICNPDSYNSLIVVQEQHLLFDVFFLSDGQAVAIKLSGQINKVVKHMNKGLISLNAAMDVSAKPLSFDDIKDPSGNVYGPELTNESSEVPASTKAKLIDLYCLIKRCQEEVIMVREEMARLEAFYNREIEVIDQICVNLGNSTCSSPRDNGLKSILLTNRARIYLHLKSVGKCWEGLYSMSPLNALTPTDQALYLGVNPTAPVSTENSDQDNEYLEDVPSEDEDFDVDFNVDADADADAEPDGDE